MSKLPVTLDNCASEPIHIPGSIQPHGALLAFGRDGIVAHASDNCSAILGSEAPALGQPLQPRHFGAEPNVHAALAQALALPPTAEPMPQAREVALSSGAFDLIVHHAGPVVVAEFERRPPDEDAAAFAIKAHRGMDRLRRQRGLQALLEVAVQEVRELTGFDRVMAYRFRHDDSGDVVAEARRPDLEPFLNIRYPASDIPVQARRLYLINTLRLIADVDAVPSPVAGTGDAPLDMSHGVLRSVSPVHIEYLRNMGVAASMSVSIVANGKLWGLLACHHTTPRQVPYSVRMACDVLAQVLAANVEGLSAGEHAQRVAGAASLRARVVEQMLHADDAVMALRPLAPDLCAVFDAGVALVAEGGGLAMHGELPRAAARALVGWLDTPGNARGPLVAMDGNASLPEPLQEAMGGWCGMLALRFSESTGGWLVLLRKEQVETVSWAGLDARQYASGPLGPRLTPRGSYDLWRETVRGKSVPWDMRDLDAAYQLLGELTRMAETRNAALRRAKDQLSAMMGQDPGGASSAGNPAAAPQPGQAQPPPPRPPAASSHVQRLAAQVLDASRLQNGATLPVRFQPTDLARLLDDLWGEMRSACPDIEFLVRMPEALVADADPDRLAQMARILLGNACHYVLAGEPVLVHLREQAGQVQLEVSNRAAPIPDAEVAQLFSAHKRGAGDPAGHRNGLGLSLYLAREIMRSHGGTLGYSYAQPYVVFTARFPVRQPRGSP